MRPLALASEDAGPSAPTDRTLHAMHQRNAEGLLQALQVEVEPLGQDPRLTILAADPGVLPHCARQGEDVFWVTRT